MLIKRFHRLTEAALMIFSFHVSDTGFSVQNCLVGLRLRQISRRFSLCRLGQQKRRSSIQIAGTSLGFGSVKKMSASSPIGRW